MVQESFISEGDLALLDAVQTAPRASWADIGAALGQSPTTAARRWATLAGRGIAWSGATMGHAVRQGVVAEIRCAPGMTAAVGNVLREQADVLTIGRRTGRFSLYVLFSAPTVEAIASVISDIAELDGVLEAQSSCYTDIFGGPQWRLHILNQAVTADLAPPSQRKTRTQPPTVVQQRLFVALSHDARRSFAELSRELDLPAPFLRLQLRTMEQRGLIDYRADMARPLAGWPCSGLLWLRVPDDRVAPIGAHLGQMSNTRFAAPVIGSSNLMVIVSLRSPTELNTIAAQLVAENPDVAIEDRALVYGFDKLHGHILGEDGRSTRSVGINPWHR